MACSRQISHRSSARLASCCALRGPLTMASPVLSFPDYSEAERHTFQLSAIEGPVAGPGGVEPRELAAAPERRQFDELVVE